MKKILGLFFSISLLVTACGEKVSENVHTDQQQNPDMSVTQNTDQQANSNSKAELTFEQTSFDFGRIPFGEPVSHAFKFTNTGQSPLKLLEVKPSCGCTTPQYTKTEVMPGEKGEILLQYDGKGSGIVSKTATVTANTAQQTYQISFTAEVIKEDDTKSVMFNK